MLILVYHYTQCSMLTGQQILKKNIKWLMCLHVLFIGMPILTVEICSAVILSVQCQKVSRSLQPD